MRNTFFHNTGLFIPAVCLVIVAQVHAADEVPIQDIEVVNTWPHDAEAFTQGLTFHQGSLYESTGRNGESSLRKSDLETGELLQRSNLSSRYFGEGITILGNKIFQLTWRSHIVFVYDLETFDQIQTFFMAGEGWGITHDDKMLIVSDGSATLRFFDADTLQESRRVQVSYNGMPVQYLNELEYINGEIWANVWYQDKILRIDPLSGSVNSIVDLSSLYPQRSSREQVLNGIAWDETDQRLFVTGKLWPSLYEIKVVE